MQFYVLFCLYIDFISDIEFNIEMSTNFIIHERKNQSVNASTSFRNYCNKNFKTFHEKNHSKITINVYKRFCYTLNIQSMVLLFKIRIKSNALWRDIS